MKKTLIGAAILLVGIHWFLGLGPIKDFSPTYDEPVHLTAGAVYWKTGDVRFNGYHHPPLGEIWAAIPLLFIKPVLPVQHPAWVRQTWTPLEQYAFADVFLYKNFVPADRMMAAARKMQLLMSCLLGLIIMLAAFSLAGNVGAITAGIFWAFSPAFLANGTVVSTDLAFALFFFSFFACLSKMGTLRFDVLAGISLGGAFASKYFAVAIFPILAVMLILDPALRKPIKSWLIVLTIGCLCLGIVYRFSGLDVFADGIHAILSRSQAGRASYFIGRHGQDGWLLYFPFVFLVKTPPPLILAFLCALTGVAAHRCKVPVWLWVPPLLFFIAACFSKVQIGHRHILAIYPFLFVIAALGFQAWFKNPWFAAPLYLWAAIGTWMVRPNFLTYFNEFIGGPAQGYRYLTDSNVDWGQGLKLLSDALTDTDKANGIYLSYFGVADPHAYGIRYKDMGSDRIVPRQDDTVEVGIRPLKLAISVTNLQGTYYADHTAFSWLNAYKPEKNIGNSIFLYDFSSKPEAIARLEQMRR